MVEEHPAVDAHTVERGPPGTRDAESLRGADQAAIQPAIPSPRRRNRRSAEGTAEPDQCDRHRERDQHPASTRAVPRRSARTPTGKRARRSRSAPASAAARRRSARGRTHGAADRYEKGLHGRVGHRDGAARGKCQRRSSEVVVAAALAERGGRRASKPRLARIGRGQSREHSRQHRQAQQHRRCAQQEGDVHGRRSRQDPTSVTPPRTPSIAENSKALRQGHPAVAWRRRITVRPPSMPSMCPTPINTRPSASHTSSPPPITSAAPLNRNSGAAISARRT